jgi:hypothetical protein
VLLLQLCTASREIRTLFKRYAPSGRMSSAEWLSFVSAEQLARCSEVHEAASSSGQICIDADDAELDRMRQCLDHPEESDEMADFSDTEGLCLLQFALHILGPHNNAVAPARPSSSVDGRLREPVTHYWTACSHK